MNYLEQCKQQALEDINKFYENKILIPEEALTFLNKIKFLFNVQQMIVFHKDGVKVIAEYNSRRVIIDYDYGYAGSIMIMFRNEYKIDVIETTLTDLEKCIKINTSLC